MTTRPRHWLAAFALAAAASAHAQAAADGEVRKIDAPQQRVTIKHDGIKALDMPPMTLAFHVKDPALLRGIAVGDKVHFTVERIDSAYTVTTLRKQ